MTTGSRLPVLRRFDEEAIRRLREADQFFWMDLHAPDEAELERMGEMLGLHELAIEDARRFGQRAKLEEYDTFVAIVYFCARPPGAGAGGEEFVDPFEVHVLVHGDFVVTIHREPWSDVDRLERMFGRIPVGSEQLVVYRVLDALTDSFFPLVDALDDHLARLEQAVVDEPSRSQAPEVMQVKRTLAQLHGRLAAQRDLMDVASARLAEVPGLDAGNRDYFRDVQDHSIRLADTVDRQRAVASDLLTLHVSLLAQRQNSAVQRLSVISTIFLPLSFAVGFFGQNFGWLTDHVETRTAFLFYGVGGLVLSVLVVLPTLVAAARR